MSIVIKSDIDTIYQYVCSRQFISKIFTIRDKHSIKKNKNFTNMNFVRDFGIEDLEEVDELILPENISNLLGNTAMASFRFTLETNHDVISRTDDSFVVKYTSIIKKPEYIYAIMGETKIILYVVFTVNPKDNNLIIVKIYKKCVNIGDVDDDGPYINLNNNDIVSNVFDYDKLIISDNITKLSEAIFGKSTFHEFIMPFVNNIYNKIFKSIFDVYISRTMKYISKKNIEVFERK